MTQSLIKLILRLRWPVIGAAALATLASTAALLVVGLKEDYRLEAFVATTSGSYERFRAFMEQFTSNEFALVAIHSKTRYDAHTESLLTDLTQRLKKLPNVQQCASVNDVPKPIRVLLGDELLSHPLFAGNLISNDQHTVAVLMRMAGESSDGADRRRTVAALRAIVAEFRQSYPDRTFMLAGPYVTLIDMYEYVDHDLLVFSLLAFLLTAATMWLVFRRPAPMLYAGFTAAAAVLCTLGLTVALGIVTSLIMQMIVILVIVLAVANCVHLAVATEETELLEIATNKPGASLGAPATLRRMLAPCTAVMLTTAIGFGSVCISQIAPVRRFGALMVFGLILALVVSVHAVVPLHTTHARRRGNRSRLTAMLGALGSMAARHRRLIALLFIAATAVVAVGVDRLRFESDFVKNFRRQSEVRRSYRFIEKNLSPLGSVEIVARRKDGTTAATAAAVRATADLAHRVVADYPMVRKAMTLADLLTLTGDLPQTDAGVAVRLSLLGAIPGGESLLRNFINQRGDALRMNLRCVEGFDVDEKLRACDAIERQAAACFGDDYDVQVTGLYHFYAGLVSNLLRDQYRALAITVPAIFIVMWLVFRSSRMALIAMAVNILPVICCLGAMGWANIPVNMTTAMMLSVTLGIAVDDAVHYIWRYRTERASCGSDEEAIVRTHRSVGRACFFTTVVITGGFSILVLSEFLPTAYFGGLVGFTMVMALAADLLLLPALMLTFAGQTPQPNPVSA